MELSDEQQADLTMLAEQKKAADDIEWEKFAEPEFQIGSTHYRVVKFAAKQGWQLFEQIRREFGKSDFDIDGNLDMKAFLSLLKTVLELDTVFVEKLRVTLFANVFYRNEHAQTEQSLLNSEDMGVEEPLDIYEIMFRSLAVNFTRSFKGLISRLSGE